MFSASHLHPMVVHFPIALIIIGFLFDVVSLFFRREPCLSKAGFYLMVLGTLSVAAAFATGHLFTNEPNQGEIVDIFEKHETGALITLILLSVGTLLRIFLVVSKKQGKVLPWVVFGLYLLGFLAVSYTGFLGGNMVYGYMVGL